jgi:hypothetical protein
MQVVTGRNLALPIRSRIPLLRWLGVALLGLVVVLALSVVARAQDGGVLEGQVVNGTAGGPDVGAGHSVTLHVLQGDSTVDTLETTTDAQGKFHFEGLDTNPDLEYWPEAVYQDVSYPVDAPYQFEGDTTAMTATVTVFETTEDGSAISLDAVHLIVESFGSVLRISEICLFGNSGDRTYIGSLGAAEQRTTVAISLPEGAVGLAFEDGSAEDRFVQVDGGLLDTEPVPPGYESSLVFLSYHLAVTGNEVPVELHFAYPIASLNVLVAQPGLAVTSDQLEAMGSQLFQDRQYDYYISQSLDANTPLFVNFIPEPGATGNQDTTGVSGSVGPSAGGASPGSQAQLRWLGFGLAALAVIGAVLYPATSRRWASNPTAGSILASNPKARQLLAELADLEDAHEAGQIDALTYERQRGQKIDQIKSLLS